MRSSRQEPAAVDINGGAGHKIILNDKQNTLSNFFWCTGAWDQVFGRLISVELFAFRAFE